MLSWPAALALLIAGLASLPAAPETLERPRCAVIPGLRAAIEPGSVVVFGEVHGTREAPKVFAEAVCAASAATRAVTVALEIPRSEDGRVAAFLDSSGDDEARTALLSGPFWRSSYQDGRRSVAMLDLLDGLRGLRRDSGRLEVVLLDQAAGARGDREQLMAEALIGAVQAAPPEGIVLVLVGEVHAGLSRGGGPVPDPMAARARRAANARRWVSLRLSHAGGAAWICSGTGCGSVSMRARGAGDRPGVRLRGGDGAYRGTFHVGAIHASPPAGGGSAPSAEPEVDGARR